MVDYQLVVQARETPRIPIWAGMSVRAPNLVSARAFGDRKNVLFIEHLHSNHGKMTMSSDEHNAIMITILHS